MIELPDFASPANASISLIDAGFTQRGISSIRRIARKGSRYRVAAMYPPFEIEKARLMVQRLISAKQEGLRIPLPIFHHQGSPGAPLLNGAVTTGTNITLDGLTPGYFCKEGFWLSLVKDGQHYLHSVKTGGMANGSGQLTITLGEMLRTDFADNTVVHLAKPMIEGIVDGAEWQWEMAVTRSIPIEFTLEEAQ